VKGLTFSKSLYPVLSTIADMGQLPRCKGKCKNNPIMTSLSAKIHIGLTDDGKKKWKIMPVGAICFECMYAEVVNPYTSEVANFRETTPMDRAWAVLKKGGN